MKKEECKPIIENLVATIVDKLLKILEESEFEDIVLTLQEFVVYFPEQVMPYSYVLVETLVKKWNHTFKAIKEDKNEDHYGEYSAMSTGCLDAIYKIMNTIKVENTNVEKMGMLLFTIFDQVFTECKEEPENLKEAGDLLQIVLK